MNPLDASHSRAICFCFAGEKVEPVLQVVAECFVLNAPWSTRGSAAPAVFRSSPAFRIGPMTPPFHHRLHLVLHNVLERQLGHVGFALTGGIFLLLP